MKNKKIALLLFKIKFLKYRIISSIIKKKLKKNSTFTEFKNITAKKDFSTYWFLNNYKIFGNFLPSDLEKKFKYLEIGSFEGMSALFVINFWKNSNVTCIDTWEMSDDKSQVLNYNFENVERKFDHNLKNYSHTKIKNSSTTALKDLKANNSFFDFVYIDGSHNGIDVYNDAKASFEILNNNGIIIFDDIINIYDSIEIQPHNAFEKFYEINKKKIKILYLKNIAVVQKINSEL